MRNWSPISCSGSRSAARSIPRKMILSGYLGSPEIAAVVADFVARAKAKNPALLLLLRSRARGSRPRPVRPRRHPAAGARPAVPACRYHHAQSFRVRMAVRGEGHDDRSSDRGGASVAWRAGHRRSSSPAPSLPTRRTARSRRLPSNAQTPGACARQNCRSARTAPATCLPRCWSSARVRGSDTPEALSHAASAIFAVLERTAISGDRGNAHRRERRVARPSEAPVRCRSP